MQLSRTRLLQFLLLTLVVGSVLRFAALGQNSFVADEFLDINSSYGYHQTGEWRAWDFNYGAPSTVNENVARDERALVYKWQVATLFQFLPPTETVARSASVLWGTLSILVVYWCTVIFTRRREIGLIAAMLCAVSVSAIIFSRRLRMYAMFFPLYLGFATAVYAFYEIEYRGKIRFFRMLWERYAVNIVYILPALFLGVFAFSVHQLTIHLPISAAFYLLIMAWQERASGWKTKYAVSLGLGILGIVCAMLLAPGALRTFTSALVFFDDHFGYLRHIFSDFPLPLLGILLVAFGLYSLSKEKQQKEALFLGTALLVPLGMAIFLWERNVGPQYIYFLQSFVMILSATGLYAVLRTLNERFPEWGRRAFFTLLLFTTLLVPNWGYFFQENNTYHETSTGDNPNYRRVFAYFKKEKLSTDVLITRNFRNYYWSGAKVPVYDFGGELSEEKLSLAEIEGLMRDYASGWLIYSGNDEDYMSNEVERFAEKNMERVSNANVRGDITVFRWSRTGTQE